MSRLLRQIARLRALLGGYFWLPCPICKEPFAGYEWGKDGHPSIYRSGGGGIGHCPKKSCHAEAARQNSVTFGVGTE